MTSFQTKSRTYLIFRLLFCKHFTPSILNVWCEIYVKFSIIRAPSSTPKLTVVLILILVSLLTVDGKYTFTAIALFVGESNFRHVL